MPSVRTLRTARDESEAKSIEYVALAVENVKKGWYPYGGLPLSADPLDRVKKPKASCPKKPKAAEGHEGPCGFIGSAPPEEAS